MKPRTGKTAKDRANGQAQRNERNKMARAAWQNDTSRLPVPFPKVTCNGKKNRHRYMGKGRQYIINA